MMQPVVYSCCNTACNVVFLAVCGRFFMQCVVESAFAGPVHGKATNLSDKFHLVKPGNCNTAKLICHTVPVFNCRKLDYLIVD